MDSCCMLKDLHHDMFDFNFWKLLFLSLALFMMNMMKMMKFHFQNCFWSIRILSLRVACVCEKLASDWLHEALMRVFDWPALAFNETPHFGPGANFKLLLGSILCRAKIQMQCHIISFPSIHSYVMLHHFILFFSIIKNS